MLCFFVIFHEVEISDVIGVAVTYQDLYVVRISAYLPFRNSHAYYITQ